MALVGLDRQSTCCKSPYGSLVILTIDMESFCDNQSTRSKLQFRPFGRVKFLKPEEPTTLWLSTTPIVHPYTCAHGIDQAKK